MTSMDDRQAVYEALRAAKTQVLATTLRHTLKWSSERIYEALVGLEARDRARVVCNSMGRKQGERLWEYL